MPTTSHFIKYDRLTDAPFLLNLYRQLLDGMGIPHQIDLVPGPGPAHPIPEENEKLTRRFMEDMQTIKQLVLSKLEVRLDSMRITGDYTVMMFSYKDPS